MYFSQKEIDNVYTGGRILSNNPNGGAGGDSTAYCLILPDPNAPTKPLKWKPSLDSTDESTWHNIGIPYYPGNHVGFKILDYKDVADAFNVTQTVFNMGVKGKLVSIGCIPLVPTTESYSFYFEAPREGSSGATSVFKSPTSPEVSNYSFKVTASSTLKITRFFIPYNNFCTGYWYMRSLDKPRDKSVPCVWFMEVGNDPFVSSYTVPASSGSDTRALPMPADANAELESVCLVPFHDTSVSVSFSNSMAYWYKNDTFIAMDTVFPSPLATGGKNVFWYHSNHKIPSGVANFPKLKFVADSTIVVNIRYKDPNM